MLCPSEGMYSVQYASDPDPLIGELCLPISLLDMLYMHSISILSLSFVTLVLNYYILLLQVGNCDVEHCFLDGYIIESENHEL